MRLRELLERLVVAEVRFVLVGGLAVNSWGYVRGTDDANIVPDPDPENLARLAVALEEVGGRVEVRGRRLAPNALSVSLKAGDKTFVATDLGYLDVLQGLPQIPRYAELDADAHDADLGVPVRVCSLDHLLAMKRAADRPSDRIDLDALEAAHGESSPDA